ncbi:MAG: SHOCT domain-containing protein [Thermoleophilia bacterium]
MDIAGNLAAHADGWGPHPWFGLVWLGVFILFWASVFVIGRRFWWRRGGGPPWGGGSARAVLAERFAKGELTEEEYRRAVAVIDERPPRAG